jgi:ribosome-associated protein
MDKIKIPFSEFQFTFARGGGPGGQNVNKLNTKVTLHWPYKASEACPADVLERFTSKYRRFVLEDEIQVTSQEYRTQKENKEACIRRLHEMLNAVATAPKKRKATKPKFSAVRKRLESKRKDSEKKRLRREVPD